MSDGLLSLNWNNHGATFCHTLAGLRGKDKYTDVTVSCEGNFYQVHKLVLSTCSEYFEKIFENTPCKHPVIVLRDVQCDELESLLNYMYKGVVSVAQNDLSRLIKVAELLQIKGLAVPDEPPTPTKSTSSKRSNEERLSPRSSSVSPYPKRRRRRESDNYHASTSGLALGQSRNHDSHEPSRSEERDDRLIEDRLYDLPQEPLRSPVTVNVDETLVKEEILDNDDEDEVPESDYGGLDHSGDGSQDALGLMIPKFDDAKDDDGEPSPVTLPDPVVEALAGPSGLQGWADGGDMTRRMSLAESFASGDSQDMSSSVGLPTQSSGQPPQMGLEYDGDFVVLTRSYVQRKKNPPKGGKGGDNVVKMPRNVKKKKGPPKGDKGGDNVVKKPRNVKRKKGPPKGDEGGDNVVKRNKSSSKKDDDKDNVRPVIKRGPYRKRIDGVLPDAPVKKYQCPICNFTTKCRSYLSEHIDNHKGCRGERRFACKLCHRKFSLRTNLRSHILKSHREWP